MTLEPHRRGLAHHGDTEIAYEAFGDPADPALLLVCGLCMQSTGYALGFVERFVERGLYVIRYDNRDTGLSSDFAGAPAVGKRGNAYELTDMAADGMAVLDELGIDRAHVFGVSMGGMIVQTMAIHHPGRIASVTSVMSSTGERDVGQATPEATAHLTRTPPATRQEAVEGAVTGMRLWGSPAFADAQRVTAEAEAAYDRAFRPDGVGRQYLAILAAGSSRAAQLPHVTVPFLVIHGTADTLIDVSGGRRTAELVPGAQLEIVEGMGHDLPPQLWDRLIDRVSGFLARNR